MANKPVANIYSGNTKVELKPNGPSIKERHQVRLWFVGHELLTAEGRSPVVEVKGRAIQLPELGHAIKIDNVMANDLIFKTQTVGAGGKLRQNLLTDDQGGEEIAAALRAARSSGIDYRDVDMTRIQARHLASNLTDADLLEVIRQRNLPIPDELLQRAEAENVQNENGEEEKKPKGKKAAVRPFEPDKEGEGD